MAVQCLIADSTLLCLFTN